MKITQTEISVMDFQRAFIDANRAHSFTNEGMDGLCAASTASTTARASITLSTASKT